MLSNTPHLLELVKTKYSDQQASLVEPSLKSVSWKFAQAEFHVKESEKILNDVLQIDLNIADMLNLAGGFGRVDRNKFQSAGFAAEAHIIAFAQALHSVADIAAQVIIHALNLNNTSRLSNKSNLKNVISYFESKQLYPELLKEINTLILSEDFMYLEAYVNTTKHRTLIGNFFKFSLEDATEQQHGIEISSFSFKDKDFQAKQANDFTKRIYEKISQDIRNIGRLLNETLQADA